MRAAGIILRGDNILLMHRFREGKEYFVLPGGTVEKGEQAHDAVLREVKEETTLEAEVDTMLSTFIDDYNQKEHCVFLLKNIQGKPALSGPELTRNNANNTYILEWHPLQNIFGLQIYPNAIVEMLRVLYEQKR